MMVREGSKPHGRDVARLRFTRARCGACRTRVRQGRTWMLKLEEAETVSLAFLFIS